MLIFSSKWDVTKDKILLNKWNKWRTHLKTLKIIWMKIKKSMRNYSLKSKKWKKIHKTLSKGKIQNLLCCYRSLTQTWINWKKITNRIRHHRISLQNLQLQIKHKVNREENQSSQILPKKRRPCQKQKRKKKESKWKKRRWQSKRKKGRRWNLHSN